MTFGYEPDDTGSNPVQSIKFWWYNAKLVEQLDCESSVTRFKSEVSPYNYGAIDIIGIGLALKTSGV